MNHINKVYLRYEGEEDQRPPFGCLVMKRVEMNRLTGPGLFSTIKLLEFGISICAPEDQWDRHKGTERAMERLTDNPYSICERRLLWSDDSAYIRLIRDLCKHSRIANKAWPSYVLINLQAVRTAIKHLYPSR